MRLPADALIAAGNEAMGMSRRFTARYADPRAIRSLVAAHPFAPSVSRRAAGFAASLPSGVRFSGRFGGLQSQVAGLLESVTREATGIGQIAAIPLSVPLPVPSAAPLNEPGREETTVRLIGSGIQGVRFPTLPIVMPLRVSPSFAGITTGARTPSQRPGRAQIVSATVQREEAAAAPADAVAQDYRRLGPTALRDTLRRRGGTGVAPDFALRERLRGPLRFDPADARLHAGLEAATAARALSAEAFTIGRDVFFGQGRFQPASASGLELIAHELTHVGQQSRLAGDRMRFFTASGGDALEEEAQRTAARVREASPLGRPLGQGFPPQRTLPEPVMALARLAGGASAAPAPSVESYQSAPARSLGRIESAPSPRVVADRVYDLMRRELTHGGQRGQAYGEG